MATASCTDTFTISVMVGGCSLTVASNHKSKPTASTSYMGASVADTVSFSYLTRSVGNDAAFSYEVAAIVGAPGIASGRFTPAAPTADPALQTAQFSYTTGAIPANFRIGFFYTQEVTLKIDDGL